MKRIVALFLMTAVLYMISIADAEDLGIQVIGAENSTEAVLLDDLQINGTAEIPGYAEVTVIGFEYADAFLSVVKGLDISEYEDTFWYSTTKGDWASQTKSYHNIEFDGKYWSDKQVVLNESKTQADFAMLEVDILNKSGKPINFIEKATVKVVFDDSTEFAGWCRQYDADVCTDKPLNPADNFAIDPYYIGYYVFGCTLPNTVVNSKASLRMEISIGDNELTYNCRK